MKRVAAPLAAALLASALLAACGGSGAEPGASNEATPATLILDFQPNAVHAGIYDALKQGYYSDDGVDLTVREPSSSSDAPKLLEAGKVQFAIMDIHDLGLARERGLDVVGVMPIVQRPLASVLAAPEIKRPADLAGKKVGVTGVPSDDAVLDSILSSDATDPDSVDRVTIGFNAVSALAAGKVDGATAFWNAEGVALDQRGVAHATFRVDDYGAPTYPELVLATSQKTVDADRGLVDAVAKATADGYAAAVHDPEAALAALEKAVPSADPAELKAEMAALTGASAFSPVGAFDRGELEDWAAWDLEHGIVEKPIDVKTAFPLSPIG